MTSASCSLPVSTQSRISVMPRCSILGFNLSYLFERNGMLQRGMTEILDWVETGRLQLADVTTYPLEAVAEAHRALESGRTIGKLVLVMPD